MLISEIISQALGDLGVTGLGRSPTGPMATDALQRLNQIVLDASGALSLPWIDQDVENDVLAEENDRIRVVSSDEVTITLPVNTTPRQRVVDRCGCISIVSECSEDRAPKDRARVWISDIYGTITPVMYLYRADRSEWIKATDMLATQEAPLADSTFLIAELTKRLAGKYGQDIPAVAIDDIRSGRGRLAWSDEDIPAIYF